MNYIEYVILLVLAIVANWFSALAGGGAGLIQLPMLIFLGLPFPLALATHKVATVALGVGATGRHLREGHLQPWLLALIVLAGVPGVVGGALFILGIADRPAEIALGVLMLALSIYSMFKPQLGLAAASRHRNMPGMVLGAAGLLVIGIMNGALSAGSGLFVTLWLVYWFGLEYKLAVAHTLVAVGLGWNGAGALTMGSVAEVQWSWIPTLLLGSVIGGYLGANSSIKAGNRTIKRLYELVTLVVAIKLLLGDWL
ncbi:sulfite exporter TauE/SafE family protein [Oceanobacter sp. 5_MG-2023]|uniref:sulfite exporter TauE/SafE family protein n=1 Tax=Oceanobacter sp. 5_MG-2023 TaxID=3062645 RepID=UPI0026E16166|nr:sulfite exporter TauE/SafE family protein [Oceanobacter sp. 5_MG-2023]MDO6681743.1 sulfite exporter TauE/SafE family protein [Oceanobacter sp. 5_MG-2023]